jgi:8-oxo-dGTP pyrophosphatase MutT (NUDIX family)
MPDASEFKGLVDWMSVQTWPDVKDLLQRERITTYSHPYGFVVCRVESIKFPGWQIRIHLWPPAREFEETLRRNGTADQQVHCHGWRLKSTVLVGAVEEVSCSVLEAEDTTLALYSVSSDYGSGNSRLSIMKLGVGVHELGRMVRTTPDGLFDIPTGRFHMSRSASPDRTATLVATELTSGRPSCVVAPARDVPRLVNRRESVNNLEASLDELDSAYRREAAGGDVWASFVFLVNERNEVLMLRSHRRPELWQPVGGRSEPLDKNPLMTAVRETFEEVKVRLSPDQLVPLTDVRRDVGAGHVYFWWTRISDCEHLSVFSGEVSELRWVTLSTLGLMPTYPATGQILDELGKSIASNMAD